MTHNTKRIDRLLLALEEYTTKGKKTKHVLYKSSFAVKRSHLNSGGSLLGQETKDNIIKVVNEKEGWNYTRRVWDILVPLVKEQVGNYDDCTQLPALVWATVCVRLVRKGQRLNASAVDRESRICVHNNAPCILDGVKGQNRRLKSEVLQFCIITELRGYAKRLEILIYRTMSVTQVTLTEDNVEDYTEQAEERLGECLELITDIRNVVKVVRQHLPDEFSQLSISVDYFLMFLVEGIHKVNCAYGLWVQQKLCKKSKMFSPSMVAVDDLLSQLNTIPWRYKERTKRLEYVTPKTLKELTYKIHRELISTGGLNKVVSDRWETTPETT